MNCPKILNRYSTPGQYDTLPYGTLCRVIGGEGGKDEFYQQMSEDEDAPRWELQEGLAMQKLRLAITACDGITDHR